MQFLMSAGFTAALAICISLFDSPALEADEPTPDLKSRLDVQKGETALHLSGRPRHPTLVVQVDVTKNEAVVRNSGARLILNQQNANSTNADLLVESIADGKTVSSYLVADPRFSKTEDKQWRVAESAVMHVFVPLSSSIELVSISPVPGRESIVSAGGAFDPRPLMKLVCDELDPDVRDSAFPQCIRVFAIVLP